MAGHVFKIRSKTPTETLVDRVVQKYAGQNVDIVVAYLRAKDSSGNVLGEVSVSSGDWSSHKITKTITISTSGTLAYLSLDSSDGAELYKYTLPEPKSVNSGDTVYVEWLIGIQLGTNCQNVDNLLEYIEGNTSVDLAIDGITFFESGSAVKTFNSSNATVNVTPDTINNQVVVQVTFTSDITFGYDQITLINSFGVSLITLSATGSVNSGVETTVTITVTVKKPT